MKKIIAFGGSNSSTSINKQLATYASNLLEDVEVEVLDLNDFDLPLYGIDLEKSDGYPKDAERFLELIKNSDGIILSLAEHNGAYSTAFKNLLDWLSRIDKNVFQDKPMLLMSAAPGGRGGASVMEIALNKFPRLGANISGNFSLPLFGENFKDGKISDSDFNEQLKEQLNNFKKAI